MTQEAHPFRRMSARLWYICAICERHRHYHDGWQVHE